MKAVTSMAQTNSGMRLSVMPGARSLKIVVMSMIASSSADNLGEGDHLRPEIDALARRVLRARQRHVGEPAGVRADVQHEGDVQHQAAEEVDPVGVGVQARERDAAGADHQRHQIDPSACITGTANRNIIVVPCIVKSWL